MDTKIVFFAFIIVFVGMYMKIVLWTLWNLEMNHPLKVLFLLMYWTC